ncbi:hypothetical protein F5J12DRAFT_329143 [Pisolithus orientalis]|uniref:uncharacterized protein n=1 Tax=Pisolithus orientalis TaxID=936130 RepID=UPI002225A274|nr:uncharacterized protein F5J12DRAFT_329143 [Pisolithus orientalis]KAI5997799.1 hypothetical protein F5J12DRAFT_329143 [Pisolithus orientalis]
MSPGLSSIRQISKRICMPSHVADTWTAFRFTVSRKALDSCQGAGTAFCDSNEIGPYSKATHNAYMQFAQAHLRELLDVFSFGDRAVQRCLLAERAYFIRHMYSVRIFINASCNDLGSRLLSDIDFLGRLRSCYYTLVEAAETIPGFANLSIMLVDKPASHNLPPALPSLDDLFKWLGLPLNPATVQKFVGDMTIATVRQDFLKLQRKAFFQTLATHAEIQLVFYIAQRMHPETVTKEFHPYIGCSKLCCFLCFTFLRFFGQYGPFFKVRGCHGRVYPLWSLPDADGLHVDMCMELYLALRKTLGHMSREMTRAVATSPHHKVESSAGITDDYSVPSSYIHDYHAELTIQSKFHALRAALAAKSSSDKAHEVVANSDLEDDRAELTRYTSFPLRSGKCAHCDKKTSRKCSKCTGPWLCSKMCEGIYDFYDHNFKCAIRRPLDSADYLERACWENEIPDDIDTLEEYGFIKFPSAFDRRNLLGVFIGLTHMGIGSRELRKWQEDGMLLANITSTYEGKPEYGRGECYEWFRENIYILNRTDAQTYIRDQFAIVRPYLDVGDQSKDPHELVPNAKRKSFLLYAILFNGWHPDPSHSEKSIQDLYYTFGFCLCCDIGSEQVLARLYMMLICRCSFQEFWLAYQNHSLVALMDAKGLEKARQNIQHLEGFLKIKPNDWCPTVWHLRLFTQSRAALPGRYVARDYGFFNCETVEEQFALKETYKRLLEIPKVDPMELHVACIQGELYGFARTHLPDLQWRFGKIMKNSYPTHADVEGAGEWRWASPVHCQSGWSCENSV